MLLTLKLSQDMYSGPIMMVMGPVPLQTGPGRDNYWADKAARKTDLYTAHILGMAVGVPVLDPHLQNLEPYSDIQSVRHEHWANEPIYSPEGHPTREYFRRVTLWYKLLMTHLKRDTNLSDEALRQHFHDAAAAERHQRIVNGR
jgi:hypothetical protein